MDDFPEWAGRALLAEAVRAAGLPWVPLAVWRRPRDTMTLGQLRQAIAAEGTVLAEARRRLPLGVSSGALGKEWRDAAWRCIVAGIALLDAEAREQIVGRRDDEHEMPAEPVVIRRRAAEGPAAMPMVSPMLSIRRRGEVTRAL